MELKLIAKNNRKQFRKSMNDFTFLTLTCLEGVRRGALTDRSESESFSVLREFESETDKIIE